MWITQQYNTHIIPIHCRYRDLLVLAQVFASMPTILDQMTSNHFQPRETEG